MGKYQAVIFDLDGVICFTDQYHFRAWKTVADKLGIYFDEAINNRLRGVSRMDSLEIILERYDGALSAEEKLALAEGHDYDRYYQTRAGKDGTTDYRLLIVADKDYLATLESGTIVVTFSD